MAVEQHEAVEQVKTIEQMSRDELINWISLLSYSKSRHKLVIADFSVESSDTLLEAEACMDRMIKKHQAMAKTRAEYVQ